MEYLRHGGRIGRAAAATGALLKVKPLIGYKDAGLISDGIAQGRKKSLAKVRELFFRHLQREGVNLEDYRLATGFGLDREEHQDFAQAVYEGLLEAAASSTNSPWSTVARVESSTFTWTPGNSSRSS